MTCWVWRQVGRGWKRFLRLTSLWLRSPLPAMARKLRVEYPGVIYQVLNRGDRREAIVKDDTDRLQFLETAGRSLCAERLAGACTLYDAQPGLRTRRSSHGVWFAWACLNVAKTILQTFPCAQDRKA
jgi:hypothetical protein